MTLSNYLTAIDLFAGVGGFSLGAARAGFDVRLAVEIDKHAAHAHRSNFPKSGHIEDDILKYSGTDLLTAAGLVKGQLDLLIGGPPCQGFSTMGKQNVNDPRNTLFGKFFSFVNEMEPTVFVAENVMGILDDKYTAIRKSAFESIKSKYEMIEPLVISASDWGVPTSRKRVFFIGMKKKSELELAAIDFRPNPNCAPVFVKDALYGLPKIFPHWKSNDEGLREVKTRMDSEYWLSITSKIPKNVGHHESISNYQDRQIVSGCLGTMHSENVKTRYANLRPNQTDVVSRSRRLDLNGFCPTLRAGTGPDKGSFQAVRPIHPTSARVITPREAARLQGFPDWFYFSPSKWHSFRQIGNSVSPILAEKVLSIINEKMQLNTYVGNMLRRRDNG